MTTNHPSISETPDAFIVNGITLHKMKRGQMNTYNPAIIKAIGADLFFQLVAPKDPLPIPDLGFSQAEWDDMEQQLRADQ
ncbi:hypothetical protein [Fibrella forsythiae]|uniref:Uncharacterized protein n=1 Tax=Fibrella forsythiae TaxID=2817061 RepID=A0ABS3JTS6_9BACT|nr:hypothetical protein [Fibrella forsythiae]MBO0952858.1 hypothetical protein [Fibrella forsythiae]